MNTFQEKAIQFICCCNDPRKDEGGIDLSVPSAAQTMDALSSINGREVLTAKGINLIPDNSPRA